MTSGTDPSAADENIIHRGSVTVGILTALSKEFAACKGIFDPDAKGRELTAKATTGCFRCWLCNVELTLGGYVSVAITQLDDMGNNAAAIGANILLQHCPNVNHLFMCGIAGAVPNPTVAAEHVRLGDIVVTSNVGIIQYDRGKQFAANVSNSQPGAASSRLAGLIIRSQPRAPSADLLQIVKTLEADEWLMKSEQVRPWERKIATLGANANWKRPHNKQDVLNDSPNGQGPKTPHPKDVKRRGRNPRVFCGAIGSANIVLADPAVRDELRMRHSIKAVEMEGSGIADVSWVAGAVGYLVVRGTCDYCNDMKNDIWHPHAALVAAAYTHSVVERLPPPSSLHVGGATPAEGPTSGVAPRNEFKDGKSGEGVSSRVLPDIETIAKHNPREVSLRAETERHTQETVLLERNTQLLPAPTFEHWAQLSKTITVSTTDALSELINKGESLLTAGNDDAIFSFAEHLERELCTLPKIGMTVRSGWILLCRIELYRVRSNRLCGIPTDTVRLGTLRAEAESVTL